MDSKSISKLSRSLEIFKAKKQNLKVIEHFQNVLEFAREQSDKGKEIAAYTGLNDAYEESNDIQSSMDYFKKSFGDGNRAGI